MQLQLISYLRYLSVFTQKVETKNIIKVLAQRDYEEIINYTMNQILRLRVLIFWQSALMTQNIGVITPSWF